MASVASTSDMILILMNSFSLFIYRFYNYAVLSFFFYAFSRALYPKATYKRGTKAIYQKPTVYFI